MILTINGKTTDYAEQLTVAQLLMRLKLKPSQVVVELNRNILTPDLHDNTNLSDGDSLELVQFVGGG